MITGHPIVHFFGLCDCLRMSPSKSTLVTLWLIDPTFYGKKVYFVDFFCFHACIRFIHRMFIEIWLGETRE